METYIRHCPPPVADIGGGGNGFGPVRHVPVPGTYPRGGGGGSLGYDDFPGRGGGTLAYPRPLGRYPR